MADTQKKPSPPAPPESTPAQSASIRAPGLAPRETTQKTVQVSEPVRPAEIVTDTRDKAASKGASKPEMETPGTGPVVKRGEAPGTRTDPVVSAEKRDPVQPSPSASPAPKDASVEPKPPDTGKGATKEMPPPVPVTESASASPADERRQVDSRKAPLAPLLSELPYELREKLGKLQINVHSYSENPTECLVFINMRRFKVGDRIGENGPILKEITPDGIIIDYGGGMARLKVWQ
jgi:hypothetical protein